MTQRMVWLDVRARFAPMAVATLGRTVARPGTSPGRSTIAVSDNGMEPMSRVARREFGYRAEMVDAIDRRETFRELHRPAASSSPIRGTSAARGSSPRSGSRRSRRRAPGLPGASAGRTTASTLEEALGAHGAIAGCGRCAGQRRLRGRLRGRSRGVAANVSRALPRPGSPGSRSRTRPATPPIRSSNSISPSSGSGRRDRRIDARGTGVLLTGRSEGFIVGRPDLAETIRRLVAYAEAGADCLYAPGLRAMSDISGGRRGRRAEAGQRARRERFHDGRRVGRYRRPSNQRRRGPGPLGLGGFIRAATEIAEQGTFGGLAEGATSAAIEAGFAKK